MANLRHTQGNGFRLSSSIDQGSDKYWSHYGRDGTGRDNYIASNNGGFYNKYTENSKGLIYGGPNMYVGNSQAGPRADIFPTIPGKHVNYNTNGTGRDSYILKTNGGFYPGLPIAEYQLNFKDQLRVGSFKTRENYKEYQSRRHARLGVVERKQENLQYIKHQSPKNKKLASHLMTQLTKGSNGVQLMRNTGGHIINKDFNKSQNEKELFQTMHSDFLAKPKRSRGKFLAESMDFTAIKTYCTSNNGMGSPLAQRASLSSAGVTPRTIADKASDRYLKANQSSLERLKATKNVMNQSFNQRFFNELEINGAQSPSKRIPGSGQNPVYNTIDDRKLD